MAATTSSNGSDIRLPTLRAAVHADTLPLTHPPATGSPVSQATRQPASTLIPCSMTARYSADAAWRTGSRVGSLSVSTTPAGTTPASSSTRDSGSHVALTSRAPTAVVTSRERTKSFSPRGHHLTETESPGATPPPISMCVCPSMRANAPPEAPAGEARSSTIQLGRTLVESQLEASTTRAPVTRRMLSSAMAARSRGAATEPAKRADHVGSPDAVTTRSPATMVSEATAGSAGVVAHSPVSQRNSGPNKSSAATAVKSLMVEPGIIRRPGLPASSVSPVVRSTASALHCAPPRGASSRAASGSIGGAGVAAPGAEMHAVLAQHRAKVALGVGRITNGKAFARSN